LTAAGSLSRGFAEHDTFTRRDRNFRSRLFGIARPAIAAETVAGVHQYVPETMISANQFCQKCANPGFSPNPAITLYVNKSM
jgi:hypothetical protein